VSPRPPKKPAVAAGTLVAADAFLERSRTDRDFYFRNAIKIKSKEGRKIIPLEMRPAQRELLELIDRVSAQGKAPRIVILKARRLGFSTIMCAETFRRIHLWPHQQALMVAHKTDLTDTLFDSLHLMHSELPPPIKPEKRYSNKRLIHLDANNSRVQVEVAGEARGHTAQILHLSELAFVDDAKTLMTAVLATIADDPNTLVVIESTPNGIGNEFHTIWTRAQSGKSEWVPFFVPWFKDASYSRPAWFDLEELGARTDEAGMRAAEIVKLHGISLDQAAWWLYTLENMYFGDLDSMEQEMATDPFSCFLASGSKVFDREGLKHYFSLSGYDPELHETSDDRQARLVDTDSRYHEIEAVPGDKKHPKVYPQKGGKLWIIRPPKPRNKYIWG